MIDDEFTMPEESKGLIGAGGTKTFLFNPKKVGTETITFVYGRSWLMREHMEA